MTLLIAVTKALVSWIGQRFRDPPTIPSRAVSGINNLARQQDDKFAHDRKAQHDRQSARGNYRVATLQFGVRTKYIYQFALTGEDA